MTNVFVRPNNNFSCSSWNYGSYCAFNPSYMAQSHRRIQNNNNNMPIQINNNIYNRYGKRVLRADERIVTNEYLKGINYMKEMKKEEIKRNKSANGLRKKTYHENNNVNNNDTNETNTNSINKKYHFQLTYEDWIEVKNKQKMIFNQIKKLKDLEDEKNEKLNLKIDKKYKEIKDKKYKEWLDKKNREFRRQKQQKLEEEIKKEDMKKETDALREEKMNEWFRQQAKKMEREILEHQEEERLKKELEKQKEEEKKRKKLESKERFREWKEKKDLEMKEKKREKMLEELEKKSKSKHSTGHWNNRGFTIGPYTDAGALKEIQRFVAEKCTEDDNDEEGEEDLNNNEGINDANDEEMMRQIQMNQYMENDNKQDRELDVNNNINNKKEENNINLNNNNLLNEEDEEDDE